MGKSTRSKVKRHFRAQKREHGVYAAVEAARLNRLHQKLKIISTKANEAEEVDEIDEEKMRDAPSIADGAAETTGEVMELDGQPADSTKRVSTHGPRGSRREEWRTSKGLTARPQSRGMNRQGMPSAVRKSGRSHRRR